GVGMISLRSLLARRITRILDSSRALSTRAGARTIAVTVLAGLAGTLLVALLGVGAGGARAEAQQARPKSEPPAQGRSRTIRGQVGGPDGRPVAGATVIAARWRRILDGIGDDLKWEPIYEIVRQTTKQDGQFEVGFGPSQAFSEVPDAAMSAQVIATA